MQVIPLAGHIYASIHLSDKRGLGGHLPSNQFHISTTLFYPACAIYETPLR